jgi:hypothetical protein
MAYDVRWNSFHGSLVLDFMSENLDDTKTAFAEVMGFYDAEVQKTLQPTSVRLGDRELSKFQSQKTLDPYTWVMTADCPPEGPYRLESQDSACVLTFPTQVLEAKVSGFRYIQTRPQVVGTTILFLIHHPYLPTK